MDDLYQKIGLKQSRKLEASIWAAKMLLLCVGFVTTLICFKVAVLPYIFNLLLSTLLPIWIPLRSWLSPPYIYIILNFIIIIIIAASSTQSKTNSLNQQEEQELEELNPNYSIDEKSTDNPLKETSSSGHNKPGNIAGQGEEEVEEEEEEETLDTIEDTWKLIMEGKGKTVKPELKKSDTCDTPPRAVVPKEEEEDVSRGDCNDPVAWARRVMRKSETFNDRVTLIRREIVQKSMTRDELTQRVEAFISNFNKDKRLQRQESEQLFKEIMNRGV